MRNPDAHDPAWRPPRVSRQEGRRLPGPRSRRRSKPIRESVECSRLLLWSFRSLTGSSGEYDRAGGLITWLDEPAPRPLEPGTWNLELGTWNPLHWLCGAA